MDKCFPLLIAFVPVNNDVVHMYWCVNSLVHSSVAMEISETKGNIVPVWRYTACAIARIGIDGDIIKGVRATEPEGIEYLVELLNYNLSSDPCHAVPC